MAATADTDDSLSERSSNPEQSMTLVKQLVPTSTEPDEMHCSSCRRLFNLRGQTPRLLGCLHSVCSECLNTTLHADESSGIWCPVCRTPLTEQAAPLDYAIMKVLEMEDAMELSGLKCDDCRHDGTATYRCLDCRCNMCDTCKSYHAKFAVTITHELKCLSELTDKNHQVLKEDKLCPQHGLRQHLFCCSKTCMVAMCSTCASVHHNGHDLGPIKSLYEPARQDIMKHNARLAVNISRMEDRITRLNAHEERVKESKRNIESDIHNLFSSLEEKVLARKAVLVNATNKIKDETLKELKGLQDQLRVTERRRQEVMEYSERVKNLCSPAEFLNIDKILTSRMIQVASEPTTLPYQEKEVVFERTSLSDLMAAIGNLCEITTTAEQQQ
ncbi:tripartite motif-containing protein 45-like [Haliotis rufescens]|uniref:tripartite motif-containing protein 45-like n=1 Tax=Haliotis rufescens TaxID=6454 RepID=UPI00201EBECC|nr:tripartite motif-containing protein 45-like [Haliotis rufescens]